MLRRGTRHWVTALAATCLLAVPAGGVAHGAAAPAAVRLRVMTFNIEYGGTVIDFDKIVQAVVKADPDVVGINEAFAHIRLLAHRAGYPYWNARLDVISKLPLLDPPAADGRYLFVQLAPGEVAAIGNVHLPSTNYGPRRILDGWGKKKVLRYERSTRLPAIRPFVRALKPVVAAGIPSFIEGDFNAPSHQDWIPETVGERPQLRWPVKWPVSELLAARGWTDTFRAVHPDPVAVPGLTWPSGRPRSPDSWNPRKDAPKDRIDQVWAAGPVTSVRSQVVGETGGPGVAIGVRPWGSDHRAVVSTVDVTPGVPPLMVTAEPRLADVGDDVTTTYHAPGDPGDRVVIVPAGGDPATDAIDAKPIPLSDPVDGALSFSTTSWPPGGYDAVLVDNADSEISRFGFWVRTPGAPPQIATSRWSYGVGDPIHVSWGGAPGNRFDWLGIYARGADPLVASYEDYIYTHATVSGSGTFNAGSSGHWPLPPGRYTVYYLLNDNYRQVAHDDFVIH
jgi:hypothetical protein